MKDTEIVREIMKMRGFTNEGLATKCGYSTGSAVGNKLKVENGMRTDILAKLLEAMDCEIIVKSKLTDKGEWRIG